MISKLYFTTKFWRKTKGSNAGQRLEKGKCPARSSSRDAPRRGGVPPKPFDLKSQHIPGKEFHILVALASDKGTRCMGRVSSDRSSAGLQGHKNP